MIRLSSAHRAGERLEKQRLVCLRYLGWCISWNQFHEEEETCFPPTARSLATIDPSHPNVPILISHRTMMASFTMDLD
jgi:hypothetical protein